MGIDSWVQDEKNNSLFSIPDTAHIGELLLQKSPENRALNPTLARCLIALRLLHQTLGPRYDFIEKFASDAESANLCIEGYSREQYSKVAEARAVFEVLTQIRGKRNDTPLNK